MTRYIFTILFLASLTVTAQTDSIYHEPTLSSLTSNYYDGMTFLDRSYDYELLNKQRALKQRSCDVLIVGIVVAIGSGAGSLLVTSKHGWSAGASIPLQVGITIGVGTPFVLWSNHLRKKANAIQMDAVYLLPVSKNSELGIASFFTDGQWGNRGVGLCIKTSF